MTTPTKSVKRCDITAVSLMLPQTTSLQDDSWNSDSSDVKGEGGRGKVNLIAALSAKLAKQTVRWIFPVMFALHTFQSTL